MTLIEKCREIGYESLPYEEQFALLKMGIDAQVAGNYEDSNEISKLIPLDPVTEKTFRIVFGDNFIKEQGYLLEGQASYGK